MPTSSRSGSSGAARRTIETASGSDVVLATLLAGLGILLWIAGRSIGGSWLSGARHAGFEDTEQAIGLTASLLGLLILFWWFLALAVATTAALLCRAGHVHLGARVGRFSPLFLRRLMMLFLGVHLLAVPVVSPALASVPVSITEHPADDSAGLIDPLWHPTAPQGPVAPHWQPQQPPAGGGLLLHPPRDTTHDSGQGREGRFVTVVTGDSLWSIAAQQLGPFATDVEIAEEWPRWYRANREVIGADPGRIYPGQELRVPKPAVN